MIAQQILKPTSVSEKEKNFPVDEKSKLENLCKEYVKKNKFENVGVSTESDQAVENNTNCLNPSNFSFEERNKFCGCVAISSDPLPAPKFSDKLPEIIKTNFEGEAMVRWEDVPSAKAYRVVLQDLKGNTLKTYRTSRSIIYLKDIPFPKGAQEIEYQLRLLTINSADIEGEIGNEAKKLLVKPNSQIMAPEIKEIKVED